MSVQLSAGEPHPGRNHPTIQLWRMTWPHQVEVAGWREMVANSEHKDLLDRLAYSFGFGASWCDTIGSRTFGFSTELAARQFIELMDRGVYRLHGEAS